MVKSRELKWYDRCKLEGEARLLRYLLERRFGALPAWVGQQLAEAPEEKLILWGRGILDSKVSLEQLLRT